MKRRLFDQAPISFNMTGVIDIVFLLIIFFMIVCQFITDQNFEVAVPDDVTTAELFKQTDDNMTTVTVMSKDGQVQYAVDAELLNTYPGGIADLIANAIDKRLAGNDQRKTVSLRIDKDVCYKDCQFALAGISQSKASDMKFAVIKTTR